MILFKSTIRIVAFLLVFGLQHNLKAQTLGDYRSNAATGNWNIAGSWQTFNGTIWVAAGTAPTGTETLITIRAGHNITMPSAGNPTFSISTQLDIQPTGQLTIATAPVPGLIKLTLTGTINNLGTISITGGGIQQVGIAINGGTIVNSGTFPGSSTKVFFNGSSTYNHNFTTSAGTIPSATWNATSTCLITASNDLTPAGLNQTFGNFEWNYPTQTTTIDLGGALSTINGDLRLVTNQFAGLTLNGVGGTYSLNIGGSMYCYEYFELNSNSGTTTVNIAGNLNVDDPNMTGGGYLVLNSGAGQTNVNVDGSILLDNSAGGFAAVDMSFGGAGSSTINVKGNYTTQNGDFLSDGGGSGTYNLNFIGTTQQTIIETQDLGAINITVNNNAIISIPSGSFLKTTGSFTLSNNAILRVGSTNASGAIQTGTSDGNIRVSGARTYASGSTIEYNGANQFIGTGHPSALGVNTIINNSSGSTTLASDVTLEGNLTLASGNISVANYNLTLNGNFTPNSNSIAITSNSSLSIGGSGAFGTLVTSGSSTINNFTIDRNTTGSVTLGSDLTIAGTLTQTLGDIILNGHILTISGPYVRTNGSFNADASSSFIVNGSGALPAAVTFAGGQALNTLTINRAASTLPINSTLLVTNLNLLAGTFNNTGTITIATNGTVKRTEGSIINNTPQAVTSYDIVYELANDISTGSEVPSLPSQLRNVTKTGGAAVMLSKDITINGDLTLSNGSFNASTFNVDLKGNLIANSTSILTSSSFTFSDNTTISGGALVQFGAVTITGILTPSINIRIDGDLVNNGTLNAGSGTTTFGGTTTISGSSTHNFNNISITGSLTAPATMNVAGNFSSSGTFNAAGGLMVFNGTTSITGTPTFNDITVSGVLNGPATLNLTGHLRINGTFTPNSGTVAFIGTANQRIDRSIGGAATIDFFNITVNKTSGTFNVFSTVPSTIFRVQNNFTISQNGASNPDVDFDGPSNNGTLVLRSTASRTAKITSVPVGVTVAGLITAERYVDNTNVTRAWRYFASPLAGATVADWQGEIQITGQFSNPSTGAGIPDPNSPSMYRWTETNGGVTSNRWGVWPNNIAQPANTFALSNGSGYSMFVRNTGTPTMDVRGTLVTGNVNIGLTRTGSEVDAAGYNLVGNPYPAPIDWDLVSLPAGVSSTISMLDNAENGGLGAGTFVYYVQGGPKYGNFDGIIASSQAFWVELTTGSSATLALSESHKVSDSNPIVVRERPIADMLRINLQGVNSRDEAIVYFNEEATEAVDLKFDATKKTNDFINLYTYLDSSPSTRYAINGMGAIECAQSIKIGIDDWDTSGNSVTPVGNYRFDFSEMESFIQDNQFTLIDHFVGSSIDIKEQPSYEFSVTANRNSFGDTRFELIIARPTIDNSKLLSGNDLCVGNDSQITIQNSQQGATYYASLNGNTISTSEVGDGSDLQLTIDPSKLSLGENNVMVFGNVEGCAPVPMTQALKITKDDVYEVQNVLDGSICKEGSVTLTATGAPSEGKYHWYESLDALQPIAGQETGTFITPVLIKPKTYYVAAVNALGCEGARKAVMAEIVNYDEVAINIVDNLLVSSYDNGNQWYQNGEPIAGATSQSFKPTESGVYKVEVSVGQCTSSSERYFTVTGFEDESPERRIVIFPNPVQDELTIEINDFTLGNPVILDMMGRIIGEIELQKNGIKLIGKFDFRSHPSGVYLLQILDRNGKVYSKRITKK